MDRSSSSGSYRVIPADAPRCVWMTAGILSYQLCDRDYDCERCPLDSAIRARFNRPAAPQPEAQAPGAASAAPRLRGDCLYSRNHCWIKVSRRTEDGHHLARMGLEPGFVQALLVPKAVVFPAVGESVTRGQPCLWIVTEGGTFPLAAPLDGAMREVNAHLARQPGMMGSRPFEDTWLCQLDIGGELPRAGELLCAAEAEGEYSADEARLREKLTEAFRRPDPRVGLTLADGGRPLQEVSDLLGARRYFSLLREVYR